jgi:hypothetical protein
VFADRATVVALASDLRILDATSRTHLGPEEIDMNGDHDHRGQDFLRIDGTYTEHRVLRFTDPLRGDLALKVGEEYVLCHVGDMWWWAEETIDEVVAGLAERSSLGLPRTDRIEFAGADEQRFKVVE